MSAPLLVPGVLRAFTDPFVPAPPSGYIHMKDASGKGAALVPNGPDAPRMTPPPVGLLRNAVTRAAPVTTYGMTAPLPF